MRIWGKVFAALIITAVLVAFAIVSPTITTAKSTSHHLSIEIARSPDEPSATGRTSFAVSGVYTLKAVEIVGMNAHLNAVPDPLRPVLTFTSVTIRGLHLSHPVTATVSLVITASGLVSGTGVAIKTSVFSDLVTALGSFTNKDDLLILLAGGTVGTLTMRNVTLMVDRFITSQTMLLPGLHVVIA